MSRILSSKFVFFSWAWAMNANAEDAKAKTLRFVTDVFPTIVEDMGQSRVCGVAPLLTKAAAEIIGYRHEIKVMPLPRALKMVESGTKDGIIATYKTIEREKFLQFTSMPFYTDTVRVYSMADQSIPWDGSMNSLKPYRIGVMLGWYYTDRFKKLNKADPSFRFDWIPQRESGFKMLKAKRIDALISNDRNLKHFLLREDQDNRQDKTHEIMPMNPALENKGVYIAFSRKVPPEVVQAFDKALIQLSKDPTMQKALGAATIPCPH